MISATIEALGLFIGNILLFGAIPFLWWLIFHRKKISFFEFVGLKKIKLEKPIWMLILFIVVYILNYWFGEDVWFFFVDHAQIDAITSGEGSTASAYAAMGFAALIPALITGLLANGFCEELLYRGFFVKRFAAKLGRTGAIIVTAVLFALMHNVLFLIAGIPVGLDYHIGSFLFTGFGALLLGFVNENLFNGSIWPSIILHGMGNFISYMMTAF